MAWMKKERSLPVSAEADTETELLRGGLPAQGIERGSQRNVSRSIAMTTPLSHRDIVFDSLIRFILKRYSR